MRILMVGAGGVGGYFGGRLAAAGKDVTFVARGRHLEAIKQSGLYIESPNGDLHLESINAIDDPAKSGNVDLVLIAVKLGDTADLIEKLDPAVDKNTTIISLQNGVDAEDQLIRAFGSERVMGGVARISAAIPEPGRVRQVGKFAIIEIGELDKSGGQRAEALKQALDVDGLDILTPVNIRQTIWEKFVFLASMSAATAASRSTIGELRQIPSCMQWIEELISEVAAIARAEGIGLDDGFEAQILTNTERLPASMIASMAHDLQQGKPLELDYLSGTVVRLGNKHNIATPAHRHAVAALAPHRLGNQG